MEMQIVQQAAKVTGLAQSAPQMALKKPYRRPTLTVYGALAALTTVVGFAGFAGDGGSGSMSKTH